MEVHKPGKFGGISHHMILKALPYQQFLADFDEAYGQWPPTSQLDDESGDWIGGSPQLDSLTWYEEQGIQTEPEVVNRGVQTDLVASHTTEDINLLCSDLPADFWDKASDIDETPTTSSESSAEDDHRSPEFF